MMGKKKIGWLPNEFPIFVGSLTYLESVRLRSDLSDQVYKITFDFHHNFLLPVVNFRLFVGVHVTSAVVETVVS